MYDVDLQYLTSKNCRSARGYVGAFQNMNMHVRQSN